MNRFNKRLLHFSLIGRRGIFQDRHTRVPHSKIAPFAILEWGFTRFKTLKGSDLTETVTLNPDLRQLPTEQILPAAAHLDQMSSLEIVRLINDQDATVAEAVRQALSQIARAIDVVAAGIRQGGRLIYVGAGTSGRLGALDASEVPPTFNTDPSTVQFIMAGGPRALGSSTEASEDDTRLALAEIKKRKPRKHDIVLGIASSGRTPFTITCVEYARKRGAHTIALTCNRDSPLERAADLAIITEVGPEVLAGSSRMKAGTAHKMVLNMISTGAMTRLGYVYGNLMVSVWTKNEKLVQRALRIVEQATGADHENARRALKASGNRTPVAVVMLAANVTRSKAAAALKKTKGHVRQAIELAKT
jgi:N-acetylmuramic acid 6-phosphate etherase